MDVLAQLIDQGRRLVNEGKHRSAKARDFYCLTIYWRHERERVAREGRCSAGCSIEQIETPGGQTVCPHTYEPCSARRLSRLIRQWGLVNGRE